MKCPFDLTNKKQIIEFEEKDPYNPENVVKGYINRRQGILYGSLYITHVNGKKCPQVIYATPKMHYPFNRDKKKWEFPDADWVLLFEKLDGTNILSYNYEDSDGKIYLTYKTRLRPFLGEGKFGNFKALWNEMIEKYPEIKKHAFNSSHNLSFELYGKRNKILVDYDVSLDAKLLFSVNKYGDGIVPPEYFVGDIPKVKLLKKIKMEDVSPEVYEKHQQELEDELFVDEENHIIKGKEGTVWYFVLQGEKVVQIKNKPPTILKYHWRGDAISFESIYTTCINAFENFDDPKMQDVIELLAEEFDEGMIEKSKIRIKKILAKVTFDKKLQFEVVEKYNKLGIDINVDKGNVMRYFAKEYPKDQAKRIFTLLNAYVNVEKK